MHDERQSIHRNIILSVANQIRLKKIPNIEFFQRRVVIIESVSFSNIGIAYEPSPPVVAVQVQI